MKVLANKYVVKTSENYRGLSYNDIIIRWQSWLLGNDPDKHLPSDILFLRGSVGWHQSEHSYFHASVEVRYGTAILVPIITTLYYSGQCYEGILIKDELYLRKAIQEHVDAAGPFWASLQTVGKPRKTMKLVQNLESFRVESTLFDLYVSRKNPFLNKMDELVRPGKHKL